MADATAVPRLFQLADMVRVFAPDAHVAAVLAFEAALARAEASCSVIPAEAAQAIAAACKVELFDLPALYADAPAAGTLAIPLVRALVREAGPHGGPYVHWGATSQDAIDTALMLQMRGGLDLLASGLEAVAAECARLADAHRGTVMAGRTLLQQATPITFGLKAARWLSVVVGQVRALRAVRASGLALQFGGASGTLASLGERAAAVTAALGAELQLPVPPIPWHAERDRIGGIAAAVGIAVGAMAKIATDIVLLSQSETGEAREAAPVDGGSSAMPQKANPAQATAAIAAARLCIAHVDMLLANAAHEHERAAGAWQVEWVALPEIFGYAGGAVEHINQSLRGLEVYPDRMRENLAVDAGSVMAESLSMSLAPAVGRPRAQQLTRRVVAEAKRSGRTLRDAAGDDDEVRAILSPAQIEQALEPTNYLGSSATFIDRALADWNALTTEGRR